MQFLCLPLLALAVQLPLWIVRIWDGWTIVLAEASYPDSRKQPLQIRHILIATGVVAVALATPRAFDTGDAAPIGFLPMLVLQALVYSVLSLLTTLPITVATLRAQRWPRAFALAALPGILIGGGMLATIAFSAPPRIMWEAYAMITCVLASFYATTGGVLLIVRRAGFRLSRRRDASGFRSNAGNADGQLSGVSE
jgi:hypothetical protein